MTRFQVTRADGPHDDDPQVVIDHVHVEIHAMRRAGRRLLQAADILEAKLARQGIASTDEEQAKAIVGALVEEAFPRDGEDDPVARELAAIADLLGDRVN